MWAEGMYKQGWENQQTPPTLAHMQVILETINKFSSVPVYKLNLQNKLYFYTLAKNNSKIKLRKQFTIA